ncbi:LuxR C-terminal-related transcriptional regulator [uncultured Parasphingorhabdus sp.]|uniref:helix-turn-helix transcriptional regulator n=1 Tax=uncultured Parasphingorhabdus sp. TaxID=2709694 RepID=UPI0030DC486C
MIFQWDPVKNGNSVYAELNDLSDQLMANGVAAISYHITPPFYSQVSKRSSVFHSGYPEDIVAAYLDPDFMESDPIPDHVMSVGHVMTWQEAVADQKLTGKQRHFLKVAIEKGFIDGVAVPLFGPKSRNSYLSMNFGKTIDSSDEEIVRPLVSIAQSCHRRICSIINETGDAAATLSERESEVLYWISRGKSNGDMATILAISEATVDTYIRRLFKKLDVHDRISAVIVGLSSSLIKLR